MTWFKFLAPGAVGPFSGHRWPAPRERGVAGEWTTADGPLEPCRSGLHVCRLPDLPFWIHEELYTVDVEGAVAEHESFVLTHRARLVHRVAGWRQETAYAFSRDCAWTVRDLAVAALRRHAREPDADLLRDSHTMGELSRAAGRLGDGDGDLGRLLDYTGDAATYAVTAQTTGGWAAAAATTAFIASTAARFAASGTGQAAAAAERNRQASWIAELGPA